MANLAMARGFGHGPGIGIGEHGLQHQAVQAMAAPAGAVSAEDRRAGQSQVSDGVECLVAHELVGIAQALAIDDAVVADSDGVVERSAKGQAGRPQALDVLHEAEGARPRQLAAEGPRIEVDLDALLANEGRVELNLNIEMEAVIGRKLADSASVLNGHRLQDLEEAAGRVELDQAHLVDGLDELGGAAIHDRHFGAVDLDQGIVDAEAAQRCEKMLDRRHGGAIAITEHGAQRHAGHRPVVGSDLDAFGSAIGEKEA